MFRLSQLFFLLLFCSPLYSQISDDFSDGNFSANPAWQGDAANFIVNTSGVLQLNAPTPGTSTLAVGGNIADSSIWNLHFTLKFAPSGSNLLRIYLLADQADLASANGYLLEMGETGSLDAIRMYRQDGASKTLLATGTPGLVANSPVDINLRVKRTTAGLWTVEAAPGTGAYQAQFTLTDATHAAGANHFFGFQCVYTTSNIANFFFDDINIQPDIPDSQPPKLLSASASNESLVVAVFDEALDSLSAVDPTHYSINGVGQPGSAVLQSDKSTVHLLLSTPLATGAYTLQTNGVKDITGNTSSVQNADFQYVFVKEAELYDILINEIMADPSPSAGLPEVEWVEIFNRSNKTIDLSTLKFDDGGTPATLPQFFFPPLGYAILATPTSAALLASSGDTVLAVVGFPSLNNDGDLLALRGVNGTVINRVLYDISWHTNSVKADGGWSLERINPNNPCQGSDNWASCASLPGGTPGRINSVNDYTPDVEGPIMLSAFPTSATTVDLTFSEGLRTDVATSPIMYQFTPALTVQTAELDVLNRAIVHLTLAQPMLPETVYEVDVNIVLSDCLGNGAIKSPPIKIGLPQIPAPQDMVINEIMFNPAPNNARYVEVYNRSNKVFSWDQFFLANFSNGADIEAVTASRLVFPGDYFVFSPEPLNITNHFANIHSDFVLDQLLPSLSDTRGNITLYWANGAQSITIDSFEYDETYHNALFTDSDREGVALERIDAAGPTNNANNWTSAARLLTGAPGSPTLQNSQHGDYQTLPGGDLVQLAVARISPDDDGYEDYLDIRFALPQDGYAASAQIFDASGAPVKKLVRQQLAGTEGAIRWDGDLDDGSRARPGIYVLWVEIYHPDGSVKREKKAFAVVQKL